MRRIRIATFEAGAAREEVSTLSSEDARAAPTSGGYPDAIPVAAPYPRAVEKREDPSKRAAEAAREARDVARSATQWAKLALERCAALIERQATVIAASIELGDCADHASNCCAAWCDECRLAVHAREQYEGALEALERGPNGAG